MKNLLLIPALLIFISNAKAEVDASDLALADESIDAPSLNIEGQYKEKEIQIEKAAPKVTVTKKVKPMSASDKMKLYRERLEVRNQIMVQRKMEQIRFQQELALARKLEQSMNQTIQAIDNSLK